MFLRGIQLEAYAVHINWDKRNRDSLPLSLSLSPDLERDRIRTDRRKRKKKKERKILEERGIRKRVAKS